MTTIQKESGYWWSKENSVIWEGCPGASKGPVMLHCSDRVWYLEASVCSLNSAFHTLFHTGPLSVLQEPVCRKGQHLQRQVTRGLPAQHSSVLTALLTAFAANVSLFHWHCRE